MSGQGLFVPSLGAVAVLGISLPIVALDASRLGGPATVEASGPNAFSLPAPGLTREERRAFSVGNSFFRDNWVIAPASAEGRDGLGPLFNAASCSACHQEDGRGRVARHRDDLGAGMVLFVSPFDRDGEPHPRYGGQIQDQAIPGVRPEASVALVPVLTEGRYADGTRYELRRWELSVRDEHYGPLGAVRLSLRIGQQVIGLGLLEAVDDATILAMEDPDDRDGDGISGRAHRVVRGDGKVAVGRFGWKASQPTLEDQVVAALHGDIGITSDERPDEAYGIEQRNDISAVSGGSPEISRHKIERIAHYCRVLAVPAQRDAGTTAVERGRALFVVAGCASCHRPELTTGSASPIAAFRGVTIRPFTDLLLHDMGDGLADDRRDGDATGREWRTPPLWGLGLLETVNGNAELLHDGRARSAEEAILWHGGEAERSRKAFVAMPREDRAALLAFLRSL